MVRVIKSEWHQVERRYATEIDVEFLANVYPDKSDEELEQVLAELESGDITVDQIMEDGEDVWYDIDWEWLDEDDWWTDRKGGYEVTYEVQGE